MDVDGFNRGVREERIGKSWHQSAQNSLQGPAWGMCQDTYACPAQKACLLYPAMETEKDSVAGAWQNIRSVTAPQEGAVDVPRGSTDYAGHIGVQRAQNSRT